MRIQSSIIRETLEIEDHTGKVIREIPFVVDVAAVGDKIMRKRIAISKEKDVESTGKAFLELLELIFGKQTTNELLSLYGDNYTALVIDLTPVLVDFVYPAIDKQREKVVEMRKRVKH